MSAKRPAPRRPRASRIASVGAAPVAPLPEWAIGVGPGVEVGLWPLGLDEARRLRLPKDRAALKFQVLGLGKGRENLVFEAVYSYVWKAGQQRTLQVGCPCGEHRAVEADSHPVGVLPHFQLSPGDQLHRARVILTGRTRIYVELLWDGDGTERITYHAENLAATDAQAFFSHGLKHLRQLARQGRPRLEFAEHHDWRSRTESAIAAHLSGKTWVAAAAMVNTNPVTLRKWRDRLRALRNISDRF